MAKLAGSIKAWASNPVHLVGDYPGDDTKVDGGDGVINAGLIPGDVFAPTAEETNNEFNRWTSVLQWVQDGTSDGVAEAGVVERSATGQINATRLVVLNAAGQSGIDSTGDGGSTGVIGRSTRTGVQGFSTEGLFPAVQGQHSAGGPGVQGSSTSGYGGRFTGGAAQAGARMDGSAAGSPGLEANGTGGNPDIYLTPGDNYGIDIECGAGAIGGIRIQGNGQLGLYVTQDDPFLSAALFQGDAAASAAVTTLRADAFAAGYAAQFSNTAGTGYPVRVRPKVAAPAVGAILFDAQAARPTVTTAGQFTYLAEGQFAESSAADAGWRGFLTTVGGSAQGRFFSAPVLGANILDAWVNSVLVSVSGGDAPKYAGGTVLMRISLSARTNTGSAKSRLALQLLDVTAGGPPVWEQAGGNGFDLPDLGPAPLAGWTRIHVEVPITVPLAGARFWRLRFATALNTLVIKDVLVAFGPGMV